MTFESELERSRIDRKKKIAQQEKISRRKISPIVYEGQDNSGRSIVRSPGGSVISSYNIGNVQAEKGSIGSRGDGRSIDLGTISRKGNRRRTKTGEVKVVAVRFNGSTYEIWLGGDRKDPLLVKTGFPAQPYAYLDLTGSGEDDWIIAAQWGFGSNKTIAVYNGADRTQDWELQTPLSLIYRGYGFWSQTSPQGYDPSSLKFLSQQTVNLPTQTLGTIVGSNCYSQVDGQFSTISVGYCETISLVGNGDVTTGQDINWTGFQTQSYALPFSGSNDYIRTFRTRDYWEGNIQSPGHLGIPGAGCVLGSPELTGTEQRPRQRRDTSFVQTRNYSSQWYQPYAFQGQLVPNAGTDSIQHQQTTLNFGGTAGTVKRIDRLGRCASFTSPSADLWSIGFTNYETWTLAGIPVGSFTDNGITVSSSVQSRISPTLVKTSQINATTSPSTNSNGTGTRDVYSSVFSFPGGAIYNRSSYSGGITVDIIRGIFSYNGTLQNTFWLVWNGTEIETNNTSLPQFEFNTIQENPNFPYPIYCRVRTSGLDSKIFSGDVDASVFKSEPSISAGKLIWTELSTPELKMALSMEAIGDNPVFVVAKYWNS